MTQPSAEQYAQVQAKASEIESELKRLNRWSQQPLPDEKFRNIGAFGSNTMSFEQWLQFILVPRIKSIVEENGEFPNESSVAAYASRYFDGDSESENLHETLYQLDELINGISSGPYQYPDFSHSTSTVQSSNTVSMLDETVPAVVHTVAGLLKEFEGDALESQLQTFDTFLSVLSPKARPAISQLLSGAANGCQNVATRERIERAASAVANGERVAEPYDHEKAMKKYMEEHVRNYPQAK